MHAAVAKIYPFIRRVVSRSNIADLPSREVRLPRAPPPCSHLLSFLFLLQEDAAKWAKLASAMSATYVSPRLRQQFSDAETWAILQDRWAMMA